MKCNNVRLNDSTADGYSHRLARAARGAAGRCPAAPRRRAPGAARPAAWGDGQPDPVAVMISMRMVSVMGHLQLRDLLALRPIISALLLRP
jgi:hypothetical protein